MISIQLPDQPSANWAYQTFVNQAPAVFANVTISVPRNFIRRRLYHNLATPAGAGFVQAQITFELGGAIQYTLPYFRSIGATAGTNLLYGVSFAGAGINTPNSISFGDATFLLASPSVAPWHINISADTIRFKIIDFSPGLNWDFVLACHSESLLI